MITPGQICRDRTCKRFKISIVLGASTKGGKLRVCRWQGGYWSQPHALFEHQLEPLPHDYDLTTRHGQIVSQAKRSIINGLVRWNVGKAMFGQQPLTEVHHVGTVLP
jgi:hypothetical protein